MATKQEFIDVVERSARQLDNEKPGWADLIDVGRFNLLHPDHCIVGQLGLAENQRDRDIMEMDEGRGFYLSSLKVDGKCHFHDVVKLNFVNEVWLNEIRRRKTPA